MRYLVTGGAGLLGSQLVETLAAHGHEVVILDRVMDGDLARRFPFAHMDLRDGAATTSRRHLDDISTRTPRAGRPTGSP